MGAFFIHIVTWCMVWEIGHCASEQHHLIFPGIRVEVGGGEEGGEGGGGGGGRGGSAFTPQKSKEKFLEEELEARQSTDHQNMIEISEEALKEISSATDLEGALKALLGRREDGGGGRTEVLISHQLIPRLGGSPGGHVQLDLGVDVLRSNKIGQSGPEKSLVQLHHSGRAADRQEDFEKVAWKSRNLNDS